MKIAGGMLLCLVSAALLPRHALAAEWYEEESMRCQNVGTVVTSSILNAIIPRANPVHGSGDRLHYVTTKAAFSALNAKPSHSDSAAIVTLNAGNAETMRKHFADLGAEVPFFGSAGSIAATLIPDPVTKLLFKGSWTLVDAMIDSKQSRQRANELAAVIADGGTLTHVLTADYSKENRPFMSSAVVYSVKVGNEFRNYTLLACSMAAKLA